MTTTPDWSDRQRDAALMLRQMVDSKCLVVEDDSLKWDDVFIVPGARRMVYRDGRVAGYQAGLRVKDKAHLDYLFALHLDFPREVKDIFDAALAEWEKKLYPLRVVYSDGVSFTAALIEYPCSPGQCEYGDCATGVCELERDANDF